MLEKGVNEGVRRGFEKAAGKRCTGSDDPDSRCPMRLDDGCVCVWLAYCSLPLWKRAFVQKPRRPTQAVVIDTMVSEAVNDHLATSVWRRETDNG